MQNCRVRYIGVAEILFNSQREWHIARRHGWAVTNYGSPHILQNRTVLRRVQRNARKRLTPFFLLRWANHVCGVLPGHGWSCGVYMWNVLVNRGCVDLDSSIAWEVSSVVYPTHYCILHPQGQPRTLFFNLDRSSTVKRRAHAQKHGTEEEPKHCSNSARLYQMLLRLIMIKGSHVCKMADTLMFWKCQYSEY